MQDKTNIINLQNTIIITLICNNLVPFKAQRMIEHGTADGAETVSRRTVGTWHSSYHPLELW